MKYFHLSIFTILWSGMLPVTDPAAAEGNNFARPSVSAIIPGAMLFTRIEWGPHSAARFL